MNGDVTIPLLADRKACAAVRHGKYTTVKPVLPLPDEARLFIAAEPEQEDDIMEYCAECRNVDIEKNGVICLGSEEYRRRKNCLDIKIKWRKP